MKCGFARLAGSLTYEYNRFSAEKLITCADAGIPTGRLAIQEQPLDTARSLRFLLNAIAPSLLRCLDSGIEGRHPVLNRNAES